MDHPGDDNLVSVSAAVRRRHMDVVHLEYVNAILEMLEEIAHAFEKELEFIEQDERVFNALMQKRNEKQS